MYKKKPKESFAALIKKPGEMCGDHKCGMNDYINIISGSDTGYDPNVPNSGIMNMESIKKNLDPKCHKMLDKQKAEFGERKIVKIGKKRFMKVSKAKSILGGITDSLSNLNPMKIMNSEIKEVEEQCWNGTSIMLDGEDVVKSKERCDVLGGSWKIREQDFAQFYKGKSDEKCETSCGILKKFFELDAELDKLKNKHLVELEYSDEPIDFQVGTETHSFMIADEMERISGELDVLKIEAQALYEDCKGLDQQQSGGDISGALSEFSKKCRSIYDELEIFIKNKLINFEKNDLGISPHDFLKNPTIIDNEPCQYKYRCEIEKIPFEEGFSRFLGGGDIHLTKKIENAQKIAMGALIIFLMHRLLKK